MEIINKPKIFTAKVMHKRLFPKENGFVYNVYYLSLPLAELDNISDKLNHNKFGAISFYDKDHGKKDGSSLKKWVEKIFTAHNINSDGLDVTLIALPRILGYVFNPVSFYLCFDKDKKLKIVVCEVNNTFGETHTYICHNNGGEISSEQYLQAEKVFHVSPFLEREGYYKFRFDVREEKLGIWIDFYDKEGNKKLITSLIGNFIDLNKSNLSKVFWKHPLVTLKTIFLIHYQAIKLVIKGIKYVPKPKQLAKKVTTTQ